jgi:hypothetical protein
MRTDTRRDLVAATLAMLCAGAGCSSPSPVAPPPPPTETGAGIVQNASLATLQAHGWSVCFENRYVDTGTPVATVLAGCAGPYLMLACRADASTDVLALSAADLRGVVTQADPSLAAFHTSHGVGWYYTDTIDATDGSWGFFPASDTVNRNNCDLDTGAQTSKDLRLCWNVGEGAIKDGWRCGNNTLGGASGSTYRRLVLVHR